MVAVPGRQLGHGVACGLARKHTGLLVSVRAHIPAQGSMYIDSYPRVVDGWCLGIGLDLCLLYSLLSSLPLRCPSVMYLGSSLGSPPSPVSAVPFQIFFCLVQQDSSFFCFVFVLLFFSLFVQKFVTGPIFLSWMRQCSHSFLF